ncbi:helix-turn-helix transcriptional regulator [Sporosarcina highlanderae]|uniref:Helix-turn-helix transcriptional regulator n=1 Tax=Sporosarcina highlanderae TaxID=3035916 RepID=A0ABT8JYE5_9BACL|nr:helix-turn-helix transcriptional regulator [Sporosarcina highlanderae]MDN4609164.1 helix-turn-helix transcriptional regulator [Sporosarcina highlanderae]
MQWNLYRLRKEAGLFQADVAKVLDVSLTTYSKKERGITLFDSNEMFILANYFGRRMEEIFLPIDCNNIAVGESEVNTK